MVGISKEGGVMITMNRSHIYPGRGLSSIGRTEEEWKAAQIEAARKDIMRDYAEKQPDFAVSSGVAALNWMARGQGYDLTAADVFEAYTAVLAAASFAGIAEDDIKNHVRTVVTQATSGQNFVLSALAHKLV